ncbi:hypothetical protein V6N13_097579 [Hibiscus sabdariffa]
MSFLGTKGWARLDGMVQAQHGAYCISCCPIGAGGVLGLLMGADGALGPLGCAVQGPKGAVRDILPH